jgi:hypothetical protein
MRAHEILAKAAELINGDRAKSHGDYVLQHKRAAAMMSSYLTAKYGPITLSAEDVCHLLTTLKWSRAMTGNYNPDNGVDGTAYEAIAGACAELEK